MNVDFDRWLNLDQYTDQVELNRALYLGMILPVLLAAMVVLLILDLILAGLDIQPLPPSTFLGTAGLFVVGIVSLNQLRHGHLGQAINITVGGAFVALVVVLWPYGLNSTLGALLPFSVILVAVIATRRVILLYTLGLALFAVANMWAENAGSLSPQWNTTQSLHLSMPLLPILSMLVMVLVVALMNNLRAMTHRAQVRLESADFIRRINERLSPALDTDWLFDRAIDMLLEQYVQIEVVRLYTADADNVTLVVSTEGVEIEKVAAGSRIPIGGAHAVGHAAGMLEAVLVQDFRQEDVPFDIDWVFGAHSLVIVPMMVGDTLFGVLEVQSLQPNAFDEETVNSLTIVANLIAIYGERTRHLQEVQWQADAMYLQLQDLQQELARTHGEQLQQVSQSWEKYLDDTSTNADLIFDLEQQRLVRDAGWSSTLDVVFEEKRVVHTDDQEKNIIGVPIWASGQIIGALEFELKKSPTVDQIQMARQVGERLGLAADNTRLFAEAQRAVAREAMVNRIGERLQGVSDMRAALETAAQALSEALGVPRVSVRIGQPEQETDDT
jgi:GAF domain-containing protein